MKDSMHCVLWQGAVWKGPTNEASKNEMLSSYVRHLVTLLKGVDENHPGYADKGYITVNSLLTAPPVAGTHPYDSWAPAPGEQFDGHVLAFVLAHAAQMGNGNYPAVQ
eukprot:916287-Heterocapsa_arctica.AAC.1